MELILASKSKARNQLMNNAHLDFRVIESSANEDEIMNSNIAVQEKVQELSLLKAKSVNAQGIIIGADTLFEFEGEIYGKPNNRETAINRLKKMSGKNGTLYTGQTIINTKTNATITRVSISKVWFSKINNEQIERYLKTQIPLRVAGSFDIDGYASAFIRKIEGSYSGIVGLDVELLKSMLEEIGEDITNFWESN